MSSDYKYEMQMIADELAEEQFGEDYYNLSDRTRTKLFGQAEEIYRDRLCVEYDHDR